MSLYLSLHRPAFLASLAPLQLDEKLVKLKSHQNSLGDYRAISRKLAELKQSMDQLTKHSFTQKGTFNQLEANIAKNKKELMVCKATAHKRACGDTVHLSNETVFPSEGWITQLACAI